MPLMPALRGQRQADLCEFEDSLVYKGKFQDRLQRYGRNPVSKKTKTKQNKKINNNKHEPKGDSEGSS